MAKSYPRKRYINRELSWLEFNRRVLHEACDDRVPVLERIKFLAITATNLDEFFMVRVGGLQQLRDEGQETSDVSGLSPPQQLHEIGLRTRALAAQQSTCWQDGLRPALAAQGIRLAAMDDLNTAQFQFARRLFEREILPVLTPVAVPSTGDVSNWPGLGLNLCIRLRPPAGAASKRPRFVMVRLPRNLSRTLSLPDAAGLDLVFIEDIVRAFVDQLFPGEPIAECVAFRVTRNADMSVREDLAGDLLLRMREVLHARRESACVRLEIAASAGKMTRAFLRAWLNANEECCFDVDGPLSLGDLFPLSQLPGYASLKDAPWPLPATPDVPDDVSIFRILTRRDVILLHPPESFAPVVRLINEAADDPDVLAIQQTLYRTSRDSQMIAALIRAAEQGKQVCVIVELKARFDEKRNIDSARQLEQAGVQVIYGIKRLKTHAKVCIIVRREPDGIRRYVHFGTGNYNETTARLYSDVSVMTSREEFGADASAFFNMITGYSQPVLFQKIIAAPHSLRERLLELIDGETQRCRQGGTGRITAKLNALADPRIIDALYAASRAGVDIHLVVRGICCLRPGIPGLSDRIVVTSIIDRLLEHSRILYFHHGGDPLIFISSADWMPRNLDRRIELMTPVEDAAGARRLQEALDIYCADNLKAWQLSADGTYQRREPSATSNAPRVRSQEKLHRLALAAAERTRLTKRNAFTPQVPQ